LPVTLFLRTEIQWLPFYQEPPFTKMVQTHLFHIQLIPLSIFRLAIIYSLISIPKDQVLLLFTGTVDVIHHDLVLQRLKVHKAIKGIKAGKETGYKGIKAGKVTKGLEYKDLKE